MFQEKAWTPPAQNPPRGGRGWLQVLLTGIVLFVAATLIMFLTGNPNLYPTVILVGNFLVPVAFVAFLYDHQHLSALTPETIAKSFCLGGILGVLGASVLEALLIPRPASPDQDAVTHRRACTESRRSSRNHRRRGRRVGSNAGHQRRRGKCRWWPKLVAQRECNHESARCVFSGRI